MYDIYDKEMISIIYNTCISNLLYNFMYEQGFGHNGREESGGGGEKERGRGRDWS